MNDTGFLYVLINPSMEGLIKVGKTTRNPKGRANELSKATGVPTPFIVAYDLAVHDCSKAEAFVHTYLETKGYRVSSNREFFNAPLNIAIDALLEYKNVDNKVITNLDDDDNNLNSLTIEEKEPWEDVMDMAFDYYFGIGDTIEDFFEAIKLYKQAARLGSVEACLILGQMYMDGEGCQQDSKRALEYFKEGAKKGNVSCYAEMESVFLERRHIENANKCWDKFIENVSLTDSSVGRYCFYYIYNRLLYKINIDKPERMVPFYNEILEIANRSMEYIESNSSSQEFKQRYINALSYVEKKLKS